MAELHDGLRLVRHGAVCELVLDRPEIRNALDPADRDTLRRALVQLDGDPDVRAVVLTGAGEVFCSGGNIAAMDADPSTFDERFAVLGALIQSMFRGRLPLIAAVEGGAFGLGLGLAAACDLVVAGRSARFAASFAKIGLTADGGFTWSLPRRIGWARTRRLLLTAETLDTEQGVAWGLVDEVTDDGSARARALELAGTIAERSPAAVAATRRLLTELSHHLDDALAAEGTAQSALLQTEEFRAARDAFLARRVTAGSSR